MNQTQQVLKGRNKAFLFSKSAGDYTVVIEMHVVKSTASFCLGILISLSGNHYLMAKTVSSKQIVLNNHEEVQVTKNERLNPNQLESQIKSYLNRLEESGFSGAVLVAQNNEIVFTDGYGLAERKNKIPITSETVFDIGSLSKQFTAAAILLLEEQGKLQVTDTLANFFDRVPSDKADITLHQLLTHSSGLPSYVYQGDFVETSRKEAIKLALDAKLKFFPGKQYLYSDTGYGLLAAIIEIVSGQSFQSYLKEHLFNPVGMIHTGFYNDPKWSGTTVAHGYNNKKDFGSAATRSGPYWGLLGFGGVLTTVEDLYLWNTALENNRILSEKSTTKLFTPYVKENNEDESYYGYGWVIEESPEYGKIISHDGATDSQNAIFIKYNDRHKTLVIVLSNRIDGGLFRSEIFYGTDTGFILGENILKDDFSNLPGYAR